MKKNRSPQATLQDETIESYLDALSSGSATPGGGAVAAITGAQAAALIAMVCEFTKESDAFPAKTIHLILDTANTARRTFLQLAQKDIVVFSALMATLKNPTDSSEPSSGRTIDARKVKARAIQARTVKVQAALIQAAEVPRQMMNLAVELAADIKTLKRHGNKHLITDLGMASILLQATASSAKLNVLINIKRVKNEQYKAELLEEFAACQSTMTALKAADTSIYESLSG